MLTPHPRLVSLVHTTYNSVTIQPSSGTFTPPFRTSTSFPTHPQSLCIIPHFHHLVSSPVHITALFRASRLFPSRSTLGFIPTHLRYLHFIWSLFSSLLIFISHTLPKPVCLPVPSVPQLSVRCQCFNCPHCLFATHRPILPCSVLEAAWIWRHVEAASSSKRWYFYTNSHSIIHKYFPLLNSIQNQL